MKRIQRRRTRGYRLPPNARYVGRPTVWGNEFEVGVDGDAATCVAYYRESLEALHANAPQYLEDLLAPLRGHDLACWCPLTDKDGNPVPCHATVLLEFVAKLWPEDVTP